MTAFSTSSGIRLLLMVALVVPFMAACGKQPVVSKPVTYQQSTVLDVNIFPQDLLFFSRQAGNDKLLISPQQSAAQAQRFRKLFFAAWSATAPGKGNADYFQAELNRKGDKRGYAENLQPWDDLRWQEMISNANLAALPSMRQPAITVRATNLRLAPTDKPRFVNPSLPGQGFPFDEFQQTSLPVGFPLMVFHRSRDGDWLYVESAFVPGWIPARDVAFADEAFRKTWQAAPLAAMVQDGTTLKTSSGAFLADAHIGAVLPLTSDTTGSMLLLTPRRASRGMAEAVPVKVGKDAAVRMPLPLTPGHVAQVGNRLLGQAYGWGGLFEDRDCSAMLRDLYTPFGLWLPRNSAAQAKAGAFTDISKLEADAKEALILKDGVPFLTLLWLRGHIGLYVGEYQGQAAFFHNIWGLRTLEPNGREGRHVLGRAVITSTRPGRELPNIKPDSLLLDRMQGMTILGRD